MHLRRHSRRRRSHTATGRCRLSNSNSSRSQCSRGCHWMLVRWPVRPPHLPAAARSVLAQRRKRIVTLTATTTTTTTRTATATAVATATVAVAEAEAEAAAEPAVGASGAEGAEVRCLHRRILTAVVLLATAAAVTAPAGTRATTADSASDPTDGGLPCARLCCFLLSPSAGGGELFSLSPPSTCTLLVLSICHPLIAFPARV